MAHGLDVTPFGARELVLNPRSPAPSTLDLELGPAPLDTAFVRLRLLGTAARVILLTKTDGRPGSAVHTSHWLYPAGYSELPPFQFRRWGGTTASGVKLRAELVQRFEGEALRPHVWQLYSARFDPLPAELASGAPLEWRGSLDVELAEGSQTVALCPLGVASWSAGAARFTYNPDQPGGAVPVLASAEPLEISVLPLGC
jgi:hypothetical protein